MARSNTHTGPSSGLIKGIYEATLEPEKWESVLTDLADNLGANGTHFFAIDGTTGGNVIASIGRVDPEANQDYFDHYHAVDFRLPRVFASPRMAVLDDHMLTLEDERPQSLIHNEFLLRYDCQNALIVNLSPSERYPSLIVVARSLKQEEFDRGAKKLLSAYLPHFFQAIQICVRLHEFESRVETLGRTLDTLPYGVLVLDSASRVLLFNAGCQELLTRNDGIAVRGGRITLASPHENRRLKTLIAGAAGADTGRTIGGGGAMLATKFPGLEGYQVQVLPIPRASSLRRDQVHARVIVFIGDPEHEPRTQTESLHRRYGLTGAEARLTASFAETASLRDSAEALGITEGTARQYLKRIFQKTDTKSQAELMKLLLSQVVGR